VGFPKLKEDGAILMGTRASWWREPRDHLGAETGGTRAGQLDGWASSSSLHWTARSAALARL